MAPSSSYYQANSDQTATNTESSSHISAASTTLGYYQASQPQQTAAGGASVEQAAGQIGQTTSIADMLAAASDRVVERCGYEYNEGLDMYYDANSGLYYHQVCKMGGLGKDTGGNKCFLLVGI